MSTEGVKWIVRATDQATGEVLLEVQPTEQPLQELHQALTPLRGGDHEVVRLVTDLVVREVSQTGGRTKRFRPLFPGLTVRLRALKRATVGRGGLPAAVMRLVNSASWRPAAPRLAPKKRLSEEEWKEQRLRDFWVADVLRESDELLREWGREARVKGAPKETGEGA